MRQYDLLIFDMDGVLTDSSSAHARAWSDLWERLGVQGPDYRSIAGQRTVDVIARYAALTTRSANDVAVWAEFKQTRAREYLADAPTAFIDTVPSIQRLAAYGYELAVATGASRATAIALLRSMRLLEMLRTLVTAEDVSTSKPSPETFVTALARTGGDPNRTLIVEDSVQGLQAAAAAGAWLVSVRSGETLEHSRFIGTYPDLSSIATILAPGAA